MSDDDLPPGFTRITPAQATSPSAPQSAAPRNDDLPPGFVRVTPGSQQAAPQAAPQPAPNMAGDIAKGIGSGLVKAAAWPFSLGGDVESLLPNKQQPEPEGMYGKLVHGLNKAREYASLPTTGNIENAVHKVTGDLGRAGQTAETVSSFAPALVGGEGSLIARGLRDVVAPGLATEAAGRLTEGTPAEVPARILAGALTGHALGSVTNVAQNARELRAAGGLKAEKFFDDATPLYQQARATNVEYAQPAVENVTNAIQKEMLDKGASDRNSAAAHSAINYLRDQARAKGFVGPQDIQNILSEVKENMRNGNEFRGSSIIADGLHNFLESAPNIPGAVRAGDGAAAAQLYNQANLNWKTGILMRALEGAEERGAQAAGKANSGQNFDNATRQAINMLTRPNIRGEIPAKKMGFSDSDITLLKQAVYGNESGNMWRYVSNLLGKGGGLGQGLIGYEAYKHWQETGDPSHFLALLAGRAAGKLANQSTAASLARAKIAVANRPLAGQQAAPPSYPRAALGRTAIIHAALAPVGTSRREEEQ